MLVLGCIEKPANDTVMQTDDFVGDSRHAFDGERHKGCIAPLRFEPCQIGRRHLTALTSDLEQAVLMNLPLNAGRQIKCLKNSEPLYVFEHVTGVGARWRLAQPTQPSHFAVVLTPQQIIQTLTVYG